MKKYLLLLLLLPGLAVAQSPVSYVLKGRLGPRTYRAQPTYVYLRSGKMLDSALVKKGRFELQGTVARPTKALLSMKRNGELVGDYKAVFYLEQGTLYFTSPDSLKNAHVGGTPLTDVWRKSWAAHEVFYQRLNALEKELRDASPEQRQGLQGRRAAVLRERTRFDSVFVRAHPNSPISLYVLNSLSKDPTHAALVAALLPGLAPAVFDDPFNEQVRTKIQQNVLGIKAEPKVNAALQVGQMAPDFTQTTPDGRQISLISFRGKYVLIDFWASWCGPCRQESPNLVKAYHAYKDKNFDVLGVSLDEARTKWLRAIDDDQLPWTQVSDLKGWQSQAAAAYFITFIPQNFLVDPTGRIIAVNLRGEALPEALARLVK